MAIDVIAKGIKSAQWIVSSVMNRGIVGNNGVERLVPVIEGRNCRFSLSWEERFLSSRAHALSASIDIYECRAPWIGSSEALRKFALDFAEKLGLEPRGEWRVNPSEAGFFAWVLPLKDGGLSAGSTWPARLPTSIFSSPDSSIPRKAAEFATFELGGNYYRMQPHVRQ